MQSADELRRKLGSTQDLKSVVRTMKSLAAVNINRFEKAALAVRDYRRTVDTAMQVAFMYRDLRSIPPRPPRDACAAVVFGSAHGLCGQFNDRIADHAANKLAATELPASKQYILAIGERVAVKLEDRGCTVRKQLGLSGSLEEISALMQIVLDTLQEWQGTGNTEHVHLYYNHLVSKAGYEPSSAVLLPLTHRRFAHLAARDWEGSSLPIHYGEWSRMFTHLIRHHLFVRLHNAMVQSMAAENASRLAAMQAAENNIDERLDELRSAYNRLRQAAITNELIDISSGFEALRAN